MRRHLTKQLHDPGSYSALCSVPLPSPVLGGRDDDTDWVARLLLSSGDGSIVASTLHCSSTLLLPSGGDGGGGNEAHGIPGRGEEDKYRGWKVQCRVDEAQCGWEEEEGESIGSRTRDMVPGAGCKLVAAGNGDGRGPGDHAADAPPSHFGEGCLSSRPPLTVVYYP